MEAQNLLHEPAPGLSGVDVQFSHDYIFIDVITAWLGSGFSTVTLQAQTTMRNETNPGGGP